jgi:pyrroline-5-carboxylate reductase
MTSVGFVGAGRITRIMIEGWVRAGRLPERIVVSDAGTDACRWAETVPAVTIGDAAQAAAQDVVILSLHPPVMGETLPLLAPHLRPGAVVLSLAPKLKFAKLAELLGGFARLARQNPNAPSIVNRGYNPIAFAPGLDRAARDGLLALLTPLGATPVVDEATIETYAVISAMGPTYLWHQMVLLRDLAVRFGLSPEAAREAVAAMVHGAAATLLESDLPQERVLDLVPVKPMAADEEAIAALYRSRLEPFHAKLTA